MSDPAVREMDFTKRPMKEFIFVSADGYQSDARLVEWISLGIRTCAAKSETSQ